MVPLKIRALATLPLAGLFAIASACGEDSGAGGASGTGGTGGEGGTGGAAPTVTFTGNFGSFPEFEPIEDGEVCFVVEGANDRCTPTGIEGAYALAGLPTNTQGTLRFTGPGVVDFHWVLSTTEQDVALPELWPEGPATLAAWYAQAALATDEGGAVLQVQVNATDPEGWVIELDPATAEGPYYWDGNWTAGDSMLDLDATETGATPIGIFLNVDANGGPYAVKATRGMTECTKVEHSGPISPWKVPAGADEVFVQLDCR